LHSVKKRDSCKDQTGAVLHVGGKRAGLFEMAQRLLG
jgi:hypothetical protein